VGFTVFRLGRLPGRQRRWGGRDRQHRGPAARGRACTCTTAGQPIENNVFVDNGLYQAEYSGWTESHSLEDPLPEMVKGYESVASQPAWQTMRNMKTHPKDAILPDGTIMSGNTLSRNIFYYRDPAARLYRFSNVSFERNAADLNLSGTPACPSPRGSARPARRSDSLLANPGLEDGPAGEMPRAGRGRPASKDCKAVVTDENAAEGSAR